MGEATSRTHAVVPWYAERFDLLLLVGFIAGKRAPPPGPSTLPHALTLALLTCACTSLLDAIQLWFDVC